MLDPSALDSEVNRLRQRLLSTEDALRNALEHNQQVDQLVQAMRRHPDKSQVHPPPRYAFTYNRCPNPSPNPEIVYISHMTFVFQAHGANSANGIHHQESDSPQEVGILLVEMWWCCFVVLRPRLFFPGTTLM